MKKLILPLLLTLFATSAVGAQEPAKILIAPDVSYQAPETHGMTYVVKEDGSANVWLRIDNFTYPQAGGTYTYTLPEGSKAEVKAWYRENGCRLYRGDICTYYYGSESWTNVETKLDGGKVTLTLPARKVDPRDQLNGVTIGIMYSMERVTDDQWWGRDVTIKTGSSDQFVTYLNVGVYLPDGVYVRDREQGPKGWGEALTQTAMMDQSMVKEQRSVFGAAIHPAVFDTAGSGQVYRNRNNVMPGETYEFRLMASTSVWKLYTRELVQGLAWIAGIAVVLSLLLYMIVGKKSLTWYLGVMMLILALMMLVGGLWMSYRFSFASSGSVFGRGGGVYPTMIKNDASAPQTEPALVEPGDTPAVETQIEE